MADNADESAPRTPSAKTKGAKTPRPAKRRAARKAGRTFDVKALRVALGKLQGKASISRGTLAKILGCASGSIQNWENGRPISPVYEHKLHELVRQASRGEVEIPARGRPDGRAAAPSVVTRATGSIVGDVPTVYANVATVELGEHDAILRFGLKVPGDKTGKAVVSLLVARDVLTALGR